MPDWVNKFIKHKPRRKIIKSTTCIFYWFRSNPEKSYTEKKVMHEPSGWALYKRCSFDKKEYKLNYYRGKDCIEELCKNLKETAMEIINREKKRNSTINPWRK